MKRIRNSIRYLIIVLLNITVMYWFHSYINFLMLIVLIIFPVFSFYGINRVKQELQIQIVLPVEPMDQGNEFYVTFIIKNMSLFPVLNGLIALQVENRFYNEVGMHYLNIPVRARKNTEIQYPIYMEHCGRFIISANQIRLTDLLGICEVNVPLHIEEECLIFPVGEEKNQEAGRIYNKGVMEAMESKEKGYDFSEVSGIREYIPGDKLQNIHWKLSVKKDELMVKERISVSAMQLNVVIELMNDEEMCFESILKLSDSITKAFVLQNLPFTVYYYSTNFGEMKACYIGSEIERSQWLEMLLYDCCYQEDGKAEEMFLRENPIGSSYLYISSGMTVDESDDVIRGEKQSFAQLRSYG